MLKTEITRHLATDFLAWVASERTYAIKLFRIASTLEDALLKRWLAEWYSDEVLTELCLAQYHREKLERWLNILDFSGQYGVDFRSAARKRLFKRWLQISSRQKN